MIRYYPRQRYNELFVDGVSMTFLFALKYSDIKVSTHTLHTLFESYENSWETMVTLTIPSASAAKEISLPTSGHFL